MTSKSLESAISIIERTVAMIARGRVLDNHAAGLMEKGGSGTPYLWAAEAYDVLLDELDKDARSFLAATEPEGETDDKA